MIRVRQKSTKRRTQWILRAGVLFPLSLVARLLRKLVVLHQSKRRWRLLRLLPQDPDLRLEHVAIHIRALQPPLALPDIERPPRMQHPPVVEHDALALLELQLEQGILILDQAREPLGRLHVGLHRLALRIAAHVDLEGGLEGRRPIDGGEPAKLGHDLVGVQLDGRARVAVVLAGVVVVIGDGVGQQGLEVGMVARPDAQRGPVAVGEERVAAGAGGAQAVQQLQARRVRHVQQVHVQAQVLVRVGDVLRVRHGFHVPGAAVEGVAEGPDARADVDDGFFGRGHAGEEDEAVAGQVHQGVFEGGVGAHVRVVGEPAHVFVHPLLAPYDCWIVIVAGKDPVQSIQVLLEERGGEGRDVVGAEARDIVLPLQLDVPVLPHRELLNTNVLRYV